MIPVPSFSSLNRAFLQYIRSLPVERDHVREHFRIKQDHTYRVISNIKIIAERSGLSAAETELARIIALFHDIGRFEQFNRYGTFDDDCSENHAAIAIKVLQQQHFLSAFDKETKDIIIGSIENHNIPFLPEIKDAGVLLFSRLLRDADKLDIWRITLDQNVAFTILSEVEPDTYQVPESILSCIREGRVVLLKFAHAMNDFRLLRLSWVVDMNFPATFSIIEKKGYINKILDKMPGFAEKHEISDILHRYCRSRILEVHP
jgi:putative nucleotidyltransferase with HDIG domain